MWWTAALQAYQAKQGNGGSGQGLLDQVSSTSGAEVGVTFDSSNWTVATGGSRASGTAAGNSTALWVVGAIAALALVAAIARK